MPHVTGGSRDLGSAIALELALPCLPESSGRIINTFSITSHEPNSNLIITSYGSKAPLESHNSLPTLPRFSIKRCNFQFSQCWTNHSDRMKAATGKQQSFHTSERWYPNGFLEGGDGSSKEKSLSRIPLEHRT